MVKWISTFAILLVVMVLISTHYPALAGTAVGEDLVYRKRRCKLSTHNVLFNSHRVSSETFMHIHGEGSEVTD
jgi:hypothetical protein